MKMKKSKKTRCFLKKMLFCAVFFIINVFVSINLHAATKLPVPRFVSLRSNEIKIRVGPGREYPVKWILKCKGLPVKVIAEYDTWRQVECHDSTIGWIHQSLLTGYRTLIVTSDHCRLLTSSHRGARRKAKLTANTIVRMKIKDCKSKRCYVEAQGEKGWISKSQVWGLLESE